MNRHCNKEITFHYHKPYQIIANALLIFYIIFIIVIAVVIAYKTKQHSLTNIGLVYGFIFGAIFLFGFCMVNRQEKIIISSTKIEFINCLGFNVPKQINWSELVNIYYVADIKYRYDQLMDQLLFILNNGKSYTLTITSPSSNTFINQDTPDDLLTAIKAYIPTIEKIQAEHELYKKANKDLTALNLGKEVKYVCYSAVLMMFLTIILGLNISTVLLDNINQLWWYIGAATIAVLIASYYMRRVKVYTMIIPCLLLAIASAFLMLPITTLLPKLIGTASEISFTIASEDKEQQTWHSVDDPLLYFTRYISPRNRAYRIEQAPTIKFTIYKTAIGLDAMERDEYRKLFR